MPEGQLSFWVGSATPLIWPLRFGREVIQHELASEGDQVHHHVGNPRVLGKVLDVAAINEDQIEWGQSR